MKQNRARVGVTVALIAAAHTGCNRREECRDMCVAGACVATCGEK